MPIIQKHNNRYHWLQSELPYKLPTNSLYYSTDSKNIYIYNINEDQELIFDASANNVVYPLNTELPIVWGTDALDPITLMLSTDTPNIAWLGTDGWLLVEETSTYIAENVDGVQIYINEEWIPFEIKKTYNLPAPQWEEIDRNIWWLSLSDGSSVVWDFFWARVPLLDKALLASWQVYVEYGRVKRTYQRGNQYWNRLRWSKIEWYSPRNSQVQVTWRWYSAGTHNQIVVDRPNLFQVTHQWFLSPELPRNAFYRMFSAAYYNWDHSNEPNTSYLFWHNTPHMTWWRIHNIPYNMFNSTSSFNRRPQNAQLKTITHQASEWYARLVVIKDGKVVQQWPHSEPLFLSWTWGNVYWNEFERKYSLTNSYSPRQAHLTIWHKYKE